MATLLSGSSLLGSATSQCRVPMQHALTNPNAAGRASAFPRRSLVVRSSVENSSHPSQEHSPAVAAAAAAAETGAAAATGVSRRSVIAAPAAAAAAAVALSLGIAATAAPGSAQAFGLCACFPPRAMSFRPLNNPCIFHPLHPLYLFRPLRLSPPSPPSPTFPLSSSSPPSPPSLPASRRTGSKEWCNAGKRKDNLRPLEVAQRAEAQVSFVHDASNTPKYLSLTLLIPHPLPSASVSPLFSRAQGVAQGTEAQVDAVSAQPPHGLVRAPRSCQG
ncbi:unnamed protein product [Closterium sp. NIES-54]